MNETFSAPGEAGGYADSESEWSVSTGDFDDEFARRTQEIARQNTFETPEEANAEKSIEEREYEKKERGMIEELEQGLDKRTEHLKKIGAEYVGILGDFEDPRAEKVGESFGDLTDILRSDDGRSLEKITTLINLRYPSPFKKDEEQLQNPFMNNREEKTRKIEEAEDEFRRVVMEKGAETADNLEDLSKIFMTEGSQSDYYVGNTLRNFGSGQADLENAFSNALIKYLGDPTREARMRLNRVQSERENLTSSSVFNIAGTFNESRTRLGAKMFETTAALAAQLTRDSEDYYAKMMDYIDFKLENPPKTLVKT